ncbi:FAD/NAD(P)-binding domain-containing protein [Zymoseptoria brevis]|uniref:FAD/NAD(P)-binding domain-containing protein n=1 Tax=Zymoseptoria brevis TaxID=1047168 RepID=A0A0F4G7G3_9PEZI|nr:FAD/NAD(P)-binding domain-containing protein [Zymoseptoria brevis]
MAEGRDKIVIVGTGWAGFVLSQELNDSKFDIVVISPEETRPYTPLLASAACGIFDFSVAEEPVRRQSRRITFYKARVESVDFDGKTCACRSECDVQDGDSRRFDVSYDRLILAPGCVTNTFSTPGAEEHCFFLKNVANARKVQYRIKQMLELASVPGISDQEQRELLHIIVVGGGPTGVEISAEISDLYNHDFRRLYPHLAGKMTIAIHDAAPSILGDFEKALQQHSIESFSQRNVQTFTDSKIQKVERDSITTEGEGRIGCGMVLWTAGNKQCALVDELDVSKTDKLPRIMTDEYLHVLDKNKKPMRDVYALGDAADIKKYFLPTTAEVAVQKAQYLVHALNRDTDGQKPFVYGEKSVIAYIGGQDGVVQGNSEWTGSRAWAAWRGKNLSWTRTWRRKLMIMVYWVLNYTGGKEIARL